MWLAHLRTMSSGSAVICENQILKVLLSVNTTQPVKQNKSFFDSIGLLDTGCFSS